ncbi:MAG: hypothetical protein C5B58_11945, partial [Acidobacteria bacterium]
MEQSDDAVSAEHEREYGALYEQVAGHYLHCTRWRSLLAIMACGEILPNRGQFRFSFPQTPRSYVFRQGWIAIFDFVSPSRRAALSQAVNWRSFMHAFRPTTVVLDLDPAWIGARIVR